MAVRMNSSWKSYNSQHFQLIWIISTQHNLKYSITWQTPLSFSLCYGSHSPRACKQIWAERLHTFHGYFASFRCSWQTHYGSWYLLLLLVQHTLDYSLGTSSYLHLTGNGRVGQQQWNGSHSGSQVLAIRGKVPIAALKLIKCQRAEAKLIEICTDVVAINVCCPWWLS